MTTLNTQVQASGWDAIRNYFKSFAVLKDNSRAYWGVQVVNVVDCTAYFSMISIASLFLVQNIGLSEVTSGYTITAYGTLVSITLFGAGFITDRLGVRKSLFLAMLILCAIAGHQGGWFVYLASLMLAAGLLGFLGINVHPTRSLMGDVGSQFLGFMVAILAVAAARFDAAEVTFMLVPLLLFGLFFDAAFTLIRRAAMGLNITAAHRTHLYQMAQRTGLGVRQVAAVHWGFVLAHGLLAWAFLRLDPGLKPLVLLPALGLQVIWLAYVRARMMRAGLSWRES